MKQKIPEPIVVTGATGFIGRRLMRRLRDDGYTPRAFALPNDETPAAWQPWADVRRGDVSERHDVAQALQGAQTVFHLAALVGDWGTYADHERVTVRGTDNVMRECVRLGARVMLASSVVVYGSAIRTEVCDERRPHGDPLGPYSRSKQRQERLARSLEAAESLQVTIIRPTNVYGPGSVPWVDKVVQSLHAEHPTLIDGGRLAAGLTHVDNVVDVFVRAAERPAAVGRTYNASDDNGITWLRYFTELAAMSGAPAPKPISRRLASIAAAGLEAAFRLTRQTERPPITREALNLVGSNFRVPISRAQEELGYHPIVSYQDGMAGVARYLTEKYA